MFVITAIHLTLHAHNERDGNHLQVLAHALLPRAVERYELTAGILTYSLFTAFPPLGSDVLVKTFSDNR